jgi:acetyltransferase-like isoleucine patch superfamily enzyme
MLAGEMYDRVDPALVAGRERARDLCQALNSTREEFGRPVGIGADVWVGGGAIILPGVRIGSRTVIDAGSIVTRDLPDDVFAARSPCRVIREIREGPT